MSLLLALIPDEALILVIVAIGFGLMLGIIRGKAAASMIGGLLLFILLGPFVEALLEALPWWLTLVVLGVVLLSFARALDSAIAALTRESCSRLIIDLRGNLGGGLGSLRLMSYLCPGKLPIGYSMSRTGIKRGWSKERLPRIGKIPVGKLGLLGMAVRFKILHRDRSMVLETEGLGKQSFHGRIVILIDEFSHSAAEMVAAFAKEHQLAVLVGNRTAGEVLGGANFRVGNGYYLRMPIAGWYTWQGNCIEGTGVTPDVAVDIDIAAVARGKDGQIEKALATVATLG